MQLSAASTTSLLLLLVVAVVTASVAVDSKLPRHKCKLNDSACWKNYIQTGIKGELNKDTAEFPCQLDDSDCLKQFYQNDIIGKFSDGFPDAGVKSIDPLHYGNIEFDYEVGIGTHFHVKHIDPIYYGLAQTKIDEVRTALSGSKYTMEAKVISPKILYQGSYTCDGDFILWPFSWKGTFNISLGDVLDTWKVSANLIKRGDETYLDLQDVSFDPKVGTYHADVTGLFGDLVEVGEFALEMTNRYWQNFFDVMWRNVKPHVISTAADEIKSIFSKTPITVKTSE